MVRPLHSYFVIEVETTKETSSGLILPNAKPQAKAKVLAIPKDEEDVTVGSTIIIDKNMPFAISIDGETVTVIAKEDVFGILE